MRLLQLALAAGLPALALAQDSSSSNRPTSASSSTPTSSTRANQTVITTTITSVVPSGSTSVSTGIVFTLTLNSTAEASSSSNSTVLNSTISANGTAGNGTSSNSTEVWKEGDDWIPFAIKIDPAFGVLGALLILTGIPVAVLGGKNRWSSLAIASGYSLGLFTLVMILRFGVQPNIQPPSPNPPSQTLRGLYLLACIIASIIGGGIGIFLWKFAKYWVSAAGGFAFGWFLLAVRPGGLITSVLGRWGLLGGLTVGAFIASLPEPVNPWMMLLGTAWIGATAFMLGVDCYTRAGLKEFYIYNLGFWNLYPELGEAKYPLTQTMSIQLGILAAVVVVGAAIQYRVLSILQKRIQQLKDEEEAREDNAEVSKAAERFKNLGSEQTEWEEKYGSGSSGRGPSGGPQQASPGLGDTPGTTALPHLEFSDPRRASSQLSLLSQKDKGRYETLSLHSPTFDTMPRSGSSPTPFADQREVMREELSSPFNPRSTSAAGISGEDDEIERNLKLLEEVRQARMSIRSSLDHLRTVSPTVPLAREPSSYSAANTPTSTHFSASASDQRHVRGISGASSRMLEPTYTPLDRPPSASSTRPQNEWQRYTSERKIVTPTLPSPTSMSHPRSMSQRLSSNGPIYESPEMDRRERTISMLEPRVSDFGPMADRRQSHIGTTYPSHPSLRRTESANGDMAMSRPVSQAPYEPTPNRASMMSTMGPGVITGSASGSQNYLQPSRPAGMQRTMTYEELADRHRKRISKLQDPVSSKMNEEVALAQAKEKWERQKRKEGEEMKRREAEKKLRAKEREREEAELGPRPLVGAAPVGGAREAGLKKAEEWRRSVHNDLNVAAGAPAGQRRAGEAQGQGRTGEGRRRTSSHMAN